MGIKSHTGIAGNLSASFSRSASQLNSIHVSSGSSRINVAGNGLAEQSLPSFQQGLKQLSTSVVSAGEKIHSVAKEFEQIDQKAAQGMQFNFPGGR